MSTLDLFEPVMPLVAPEPAAPAGHPVGRLAGFIDRADLGTRAALARLDPDAMRPHQIAALARALIEAGLSPDTWQPATWKRWALIAHGMALAGHDRTRRLGQQLGTVQTGQPIVAEARVTKLLVSRGDAFLQIVPRLLRLLVSKQVKPNWYDLSKLILKNDSQDADEQEEAEALRLRIAGEYFSAIARAH
jgi:CRISPR system Cascade subunit CasB